MRKKAVLIFMFAAFWQVSNHQSLASSPPIIWLYDVSQSSIISGEQVTIAWIVIAADKVTIDNGLGDVGLAGQKTLTLSSPGVVTFTLTATNSAGTSVARLSVEVLGFKKFFGGGWDDEGYCVQPTFDGGYVLAGTYRTKSSGGEDILLLKTDSSGEMLWQKTYGGTGTDKGYFVQQTSDGGFILAGESGVSNLIKTDVAGNKVWEKKFVWPTYYLYCVLQTSDGGFIIGSNKGHLIKTDGLGNTLWDKQYAGADYVNSVSLTSDGGYILAGTFWQNNTAVDQIFLIKTDALGNQIWRRQFGGATWDRGYSVAEAAGGGYILAGTSQNSKGWDIGWIIKVDGSGNTVWDQQFGNTSDTRAVDLYCATATADGGAVVAGSYEINGPDEQDIYVIKVNASGNVDWSKIIGGDGYEIASSIAQTPDGGLIVAGTADTEMTAGKDVLLMKIK